MHQCHNLQTRLREAIGEQGAGIRERMLASPCRPEGDQLPWQHVCWRWYCGDWRLPAWHRFTHTVWGEGFRFAALFAKGLRAIAEGVYEAVCGVVSCDSGRARPWLWLSGVSLCSLCFQTAPWRHISSSQQAQGTHHGHCSHRRRRCPFPKDALLVSRGLEFVAMVTSPPNQCLQIVPSPVQRGW